MKQLFKSIAVFTVLITGCKQSCDQNEDMKFDTIAVSVTAPSSHIMKGETYKAQISLMAFNSTNKPEIVIDDMKETEKVNCANGMGMYESTPAEVGLYHCKGKINLKGKDGNIKSYPFETEYMVSEPVVIVSPRVLYRDRENPLDIAVAGVPANDLTVTVVNATITGEKGNYSVKPGKENKCTIIVEAEVNGQKKEFGRSEFEVK